ncbi:MAG: hypothetical protein LBC92_03895, partial [Rickettsiales bacterium]|nr:hypothetical protein [Rickettsiales bacterium]
MKLSIIGSGRTGCACCYVCGLQSIFNEIVMIDKDEKKAIGKAIDLEQAFILNGSNTRVKGSYDYNDIKDSDVIVITASVPHPSVKEADDANMGVRELMLSGNRIVMDEIVSKLKKIISTDEKQPLIIMLTNPMDLILSYFMKIGNFNRKKTIGSGNLLDTARFKY